MRPAHHAPLGRATLSHRTVPPRAYSFLVVMPLLWSGHRVSDGKAVLIPFTGIALPALLPEAKRWRIPSKTCTAASARRSNWVIGAHVLAAFWHHLVPATTPCGGCCRRASCRQFALPSISA